MKKDVRRENRVTHAWSVPRPLPKAIFFSWRRSADVRAQDWVRVKDGRKIPQKPKLFMPGRTGMGSEMLSHYLQVNSERC